MNIPWKLKSKLFSTVDRFKLSSAMYLAQKFISGRSKSEGTHVNRRWKQHQQVIKSLEAPLIAFEFGAGKTLAQNIYLSELVSRQIVVDLNFMLDLKLCEATRRNLVANHLIKSGKPIFTTKDLLNYGIEYEAPFDASDTNLKANSIDICISTATLEHIPVEEISTILVELHRIIKLGGIVSAVIDYSDHYWHTDRSISPLNFLKYSENEWSRYNHSCHYQNRLRHADYIRIFSDNGFELIKAELDFYDGKIHPQIISKYKRAEPSWSALASHCVFKKVML